MGLKWSINGNNFEDFGIHVKSSKGLLDKLKPRERNSYTWAEYHGKQLDLSKPMYEAREIELECWLKADTPDDLNEKFIAFTSLFDTRSTKRFLLEPFENKGYAFEVVLNSGIELEKEFRDGEMFGIFKLNLIEPNPIKKVLKTTLDKLKLKYDSPMETEIFLGDGTKKIGRGNVNFTIDYSAPNYQGSGISLIQISNVNNTYYELYLIPDGISEYMFSCSVKLTSSKNIILYIIGRKPDNTYSVVTQSEIIDGITGDNELYTISELDISNYSKIFFKVLDSDGNEVPGLEFSNPRIESAEIIGDWQNMLGKEKIIIIAGNIDDVKNLETPAEILWNKI